MRGRAVVFTRLTRKGIEESRDVPRHELRLFGWGEVAATWHPGPLPDVVKALRPLARRIALGDEHVRKHRNRRGHRHPAGQRRLELGLRGAVVVVVPY